MREPSMRRPCGQGSPAPRWTAARPGGDRPGTARRLGRLGASLVVGEGRPYPACSGRDRGCVEVGDRARTLDGDRDVGDHSARTRRHHDDAVGNEDRLGDAVGDHHDRRGRSLPQPEELEVEALAGQRIERAERLVEQEHVRLERERTCEGDPLARATRELGRPRRDDRRVEPDEIGQAVEAFPPAPGVPAGELERVGDVGGRRPPRQQPRLLEYETDPRVGALDHHAIEARGATDRSEEARDDAEEGRFSAAVGPDEGHDPTARDREVQAVEDRQ